MASIVLYPRAAPAGTLRIWAGVFDTDVAPMDIVWMLDGTEVPAVPVRPLVPAHKSGSKSFTGVFDLTIPPTDRASHQIIARGAGTSSSPLAVRSIPAEVPSDDWLRILMTSCYHQAEDRGGLAGRAYDTIPAAEHPDLTLFMGDQVYLDLPTLDNFPTGEAELADKFEKSYRKNWTPGGGLSAILASAPSVCSPDDHEYWNNFPHASPIIQNSWGEAGRNSWKQAADDTFDAFQVAAPAERGDGVEVDIDPLSIMILDQRSRREADCSATLTAAALDQLNDWVDRLIAERKYGAVVTGQSLLDKPVGDLKGNVADSTLR